MTIPWFDSSTGAPNFKVHPMNDRGNQESVMKHLKKIKAYGVVPSARGDAYAIVSSGCRPPCWLISFGTVATAFYKAPLTSNTNKFDACCHAARIVG